tara:strand:+ start:2366 stop:7147 length:4782 start_codon:yes stop_codon:yes gene_type:complete
MPNNRLILRSIQSPWVTPIPDVTKGSVLTHEELDENQIYLRGEVIYDAVQSGNTVFLYKINGDNLSFSGAVASGLERINEGSGDGWRLIGRDPSKYGPIGETAIDFSLSTVNSSDNGSTGYGAVTFGLNNKNPFTETLMLGRYIEGSPTTGNHGSNIIVSENFDGSPSNFYNNIYNSIFGVYTSNIGTNGAGLGTAVMYQSLGIGENLNMYAGRNSAMIGNALSGGSASTTIVGVKNVDLTISNATSSINSTYAANPRFIVGTGGSSYRANGFVVMHDGTASFPSLSIAEIDSSGNDSAITKEWVNVNFSAGTGNSNYLGKYTSFSALTSAHPTADPGNYADVDLGVGNDVTRYIWDDDDNIWVEQLGESTALTDAQIKIQYENNANTNEFSDFEKLKLSGLTYDTNDYVTGFTFDSTTGDASIDMFSGSTYTTNFDGRYSLTGHTHTEYSPTGHTHSQYVDTSGSPLVNQLALFSDPDTITGDSNLIWITSTLTIGGEVAIPYNRYYRATDSGAISRSIFGFSSPQNALVFGSSGMSEPIKIFAGNASPGLVMVNSTQDIGIGNEVPLEKLHVEGNILAHSFITSGGTSSQFVKGDGTLDTNVYALSGDTSTNTDDYVTGATFNTGTGDLDLTRLSGGTVTINLDGRYGLSGAQTLSFTATTGNLEISGGNIVNLDNRYSLTGHTHSIYDDHIADGDIHYQQSAITITSTQVSNFNDAVSATTSVLANTAHATSIGTDHGYIDQDVTTTAKPTYRGLTIQDINSASGSTLQITNDFGDSPKTIQFSNTTGDTAKLTGFGRASTIGGAYMSFEVTDVSNLVEVMRLYADELRVSGSTWAHSFVKSGGTSTQFLKADGSIDTNTYITSESDNQTLSFTAATGDLEIFDGNIVNLDGRYALTGDTSTNTDDYVSGFTFNNTTGDASINMVSGSTFTTNFDGRYALTGDTSINTDDFLTGATFNTSTGDIDLITKSGSTVTVNLDGRYSLTGDTSTNTDDYVSGATFNTGDGILTFTRQSGDTFNVDLDGRYLTSETDSQTLTFSATTGDLEISSGNIVSLDGRYSLTGHTHSIYDDHIADTSIHYEQSAITITSTQVSDFDDAVTGNTVVVANTVHATSVGTDHGYIDQDVTTTSKPTYRGLTIKDINSASGSTLEINNDFGDSPKSLLFSNTTGDTAKITGFGRASTVGGAYTSFEVTDNTSLVEVMRLYADELRVSGNTWSNLFTTSGGTTSNDWDSAYNDTITGMTVSGTTTKTISLFQRDGGLVQANFTDEVGVGAGNDYLTGATFNTSTGDLTMSLFSGNTVVANLDNRYSLTGHTHSGFGDVFKVGVPINNQIGVWTGDGTLEGDTKFTFNGQGTASLIIGGYLTQTAYMRIYGGGSGPTGGNMRIYSTGDYDTDDAYYESIALGGTYTLRANSTGTFLEYTSATSQLALPMYGGGTITGTTTYGLGVDVSGNIIETPLTTGGDYLPLTGGTLTGPITATTINIDKSELDYQENLTVDSATTETIATVSILSHKAVFFDYVVSEGTNIRAGTIMSTFMGGTTAFTDNSTTDIGDTSGVIFSTDISGSDLRLLADTTTNGWEIKVMIRAL